MESPTSFERCVEISEANVACALASRQAFRALLERAAEVSRPEEGGPRILMALARLATGDCAWLEGDLRIEIAGDDRETSVDVLIEMGYGYRERVFPTTRMRVPCDEFARAIRLVPWLVAPLEARSEGNRILLTAAEDARRSTAPPPAVDIDEGSLLDPPPPAVSGTHRTARPAPEPPPTVRREIPQALLAEQRPSTRAMVVRMPAVRPELHTKPTVARMPAVRPELHTKPTVARMPAVRPELHTKPTVARMPAVRPELHSRPTRRMPAVRPDVHSKPTVVRMTAIRLEDLPEARREDQADIDEAWENDD